MKAYINGGHYHVHIDKKVEFPSLLQKHLETNVQYAFVGTDTGKKLVLSCNSKERNFSVVFVPPESPWPKLKEIYVTITKEQYNHLNLNRIFISRFGGGSSIDLHLEDNIEDFI